MGIEKWVWREHSDKWGVEEWEEEIPVGGRNITNWQPAPIRHTKTVYPVKRGWAHLVGQIFASALIGFGLSAAVRVCYELLG